MAKDLPYFKFFVSEWSDGDITLEDHDIQGVFINVCSYYWSNGCDVSYAKLIKKFKNCTDSIDTLENAGILKVEGGDVWINFLDEQLGDRKQTSKKNSEAGKASAEKRRLERIQRESNQNPTPVEITLNGKSTIKKREEKRREEENLKTFDIFWTQYGKKGTRMKGFKNWKKLNNSDKDKCFEVVDAYVKSTPDKQFRKGCESWLYNECWNDTIETQTINKRDESLDKGYIHIMEQVRKAEQS